MAVVGIDLGTTYSVIATPKHFPDGKNFVTVRGVTVIKDESNRRLLPSLVASNAQGNLVVGHTIRADITQFPDTVMCVKRHMGEDCAYKLGREKLLPEEVSAEILRRLKEIAEKQMGEPVEEAVITVPAYFTGLQKQLTKQAGEKAGLRVGDILQEPVAAALMYCYDDNRDPLTIMTYDLGGGTFDIAILRKQAGFFQILAFDGDRFLGGSDFDGRLAAWIIKRLEQAGQPIDIKRDSPEWYKLLFRSEEIKKALGDKESFTLTDQNPGLKYLNGEPVTIDDLVITRSDFMYQIEDFIDTTVRLCRQAMQKAQIQPKELDEVIMVGGSSRIPAIGERLEKEFGIKPKLIEPDLCVAIGAAIAAQRLGRWIGPLHLSYLPETTSLTTLTVTGTVDRSDELPDSEQCRIVLSKTGEPFTVSQPLAPQGGFLLANVPLTPEKVNEFDLRLEKGEKELVLTHHITVRQASTGESQHNVSGLDGNILAKPISIRTVSGLHTIAKEGTPLAYTGKVLARTTDQSGMVRIPVYEGNVEIGAIIVTDIPQDLELGSQVVINLNLKEDFYIEGEAYLPRIEKKGSTRIEIPRVKERTRQQLQEQYQELVPRVAEALVQADRDKIFQYGGLIESAMGSCRKMLYVEDEKVVVLAKVQEQLAEVETLLSKLRTWQPSPPPDQFEDMRQEIKDILLPDLYAAKPAEKDSVWEGQLKAIVMKGEKALREKNDAVWAEANRDLQRLRNRVSEVLERAQRRPVSGKPPPPPDPHMIKYQLLSELAGLEEQVKRRRYWTQLEAEFQSCHQALDKIDTEQTNAMPRLLDYYQGRHMPLKAKVDQFSRPAPKPNEPHDLGLVEKDN